MTYYVYILIDPRTDKIFYVGKGCMKRMYEHVKNVQRNRIPNNNRHLYNKIKQILSFGKRVEYKKVLITENEQDAFNKEIDLIAEIGLFNLCNLTDGGEGTSGRRCTAETKRKISEAHKGKKASDITRKKLSDLRKGKKFSDAHKEKISLALKGRILSEEHKRNISDVNKGKIHSEETKKKMSENNPKYWKGKKLSEETKRKMSIAKKGQISWIKGKKHSEETKRKISQSTLDKQII